MRVSSITAPFDSNDPASLAAHESGIIRTTAWAQIKLFFHKLDRLMTAITHAEGGNLDAVQKILDENRPTKKTGRQTARNGGIQWQ